MQSPGPLRALRTGAFVVCRDSAAGGARGSAGAGAPSEVKSVSCCARLLALLAFLVAGGESGRFMSVSLPLAG